MLKLIATLAASAAIVACGFVHGIWTERWGLGEAPAKLGERLREIPMKIGDWEGEDIPQKPTAYDRELSGSIQRKYTNIVTGQAVIIAVLCGRPGPICIHTPDVCYDASGYEVGTRNLVKLPGSDDEFWQADAVRNRTASADTTRLRIFWAWNYGQGWQAAQDPRAEFAAQPALVKLYVIRDMAQANEKVEGDACVQFLQAFVTDGQRDLFSDRRSE
jgi:hypothetical protein